MQPHINWSYDIDIKENIHDEEEVVVAELESVPSHKNQHQNEDSPVPEVTTLMVDNEESVASTTKHKSVQEQGSYHSAGQSCMLQIDESRDIDGEASTHDEDSQVPEVKTLMVDKKESVTPTTEHQPVQEQGSYPSVGKEL